MSTSILNFSIDAGTTYYLEAEYLDNITNLPNDLTGYTAVLDVRYSYGDARILLSLSTFNGRILLDTLGNIMVSFLPEDTNPSLQTPYAWTNGVYNLVLTDPNGVVIKLLSGIINVLGTV